MSAAADRPPDDPWVHCYRAIGDDEFPDIGRVHEVPIVPFTDSDPFPFDRPIAAIVELPHEMLGITELSPYDGTFVGKRIQRDGSIAPYPMVTHWRQTVVRIPATIPALADYLEQARKRNICLIRGAPADLAREKTRRQKAGGDRGDHGFTDEPTTLHFFDIDGATGNWRDDPEAAVKRIVTQLGEPWASASFVWFFSAGHGLEMETVTVGDKKHKRWTGGISDDKIRVRLAFITDRALTWREAAALTAIVKAASGLPLDEAICRTVQPNYITRPLWDGHPGCDALGDIPTIGWVGGGTDVTTVTVTTSATVTTTVTATVAVPDDLAHQARWAAAQGHGVVIADHPDAISAVRGIGSDGRVRQHMMAAIRHLLKANPPRDHISCFDHSLALADQLHAMIKQLSETIGAQLAAHGRQWGDLAGYLDGMSDWARWLMERPGAFHRKTVKLAHENRDDDAAQAGAEEIYDRVARTIEEANEGVTLLIAPTGSRKSTEVRKAAVWMVTEHPDRSADQSVVILVPRHKLGDEQIKALHEEHPDANFTAAVWRGRHREDPQTPGKLMCWRSPEAKALEDALLDVQSHLCKRGRGLDAVVCPHLPYCGYQRQARTSANIWFTAHEMMTHPPPKAFGTVARVLIDESPLDAFVFGTDITDEVMLDLSELLAPPTRSFDGENTLMNGRKALHHALSKMQLPDDPHKGAPISIEDLEEFASRSIKGKLTDFIFASLYNHALHNPELLAALEWKDKVEPKIRPDMTAKQVHEQLALATGNARIKKLVLLWTLLGDGKAGRLQLHNSDKGRIIRMVGLRLPAEEWQVPTLITDATGDPEPLRAIWPDLKCEVEAWQQLPRPPSVRLMQCVDRAVSKHAVAIEGEGNELKRRQAAARRLYAAVLAKALTYGGAASGERAGGVGVIVYKSTKEWIITNCLVPPWLKLLHHGDVTGSNALQHVRALFVVGRPLASDEAVTRMTEALFGDYIAERDYKTRKKGGRIPIVPDAANNNIILVDVWEHPDPRAERMRRQVTEAALIQAVGRARAGLRGPGGALDIHLWTDVPLPELGPVEPVLWDEVAVGLDEQMLATGGIWLGSAPHAAKVYPELFSENTLKQARKRAQTQSGSGPTREGTFPIVSIIGNVPSLLSPIRYQLSGERQKPARALTLLGLSETRAWLEERLGPLVKFEVIVPEAPAAAAAE